MKTQLTLLLAIAGIGLCAAQNAPSPAPAEVRKAEVTVTEKRAEKGPKEAPDADKKLVPYIGVLTREVPTELRTQFSLLDGFGLLVEEVMPDSPAQAAGLKAHDILVKLGDQQLVNMEQLLTLVRSKKKGESVPLTVITGGKETQVQITLGERLVPVEESRHPQGMMPYMNRFFMDGPRPGDTSRVDEELRGRMEHLQREMREYQERVQQWNRDGHKGPFPQPPQLHPRGEHPTKGPTESRREDSPDHRSEVKVETHTSAVCNITRKDDSGEYQLKNEDGKQTFIVRPANGPEQSWPVNTEEEREAVPEPFREKLRLFDNMQLQAPRQRTLIPAPKPPEAPTPPTPPDSPPRKRGSSI
jgi:hypothetical protein